MALTAIPPQDNLHTRVTFHRLLINASDSENLTVIKSQCDATVKIRLMVIMIGTCIQVF